MDVERQESNDERQMQDSEVRIPETLKAEDAEVRRQETINAPKKRKINVTLRRVNANRRNAVRSTGPRTPEGKNVARWNALKHGLLSREVIIPEGLGKENVEEFLFLLEQLRCDLRPDGALEEILVEKIAVGYWRLRRLLHSETGEVRKGLVDAVHEAAAKQRRLKLLGREMTVEQEDAWIETIQDCRHVPESEVADKLLRYEMTLERGLHRALHLLERIQLRRKGEAVPPPVTVEFSGIT